MEVKGRSIEVGQLNKITYTSMADLRGVPLEHRLPLPLVPKDTAE